MTELLHQELTQRIIGSYYSVFNQLGQTYPENIYERAMMHLLSQQGIPCSRQDEYEIHYKERLVGVQRLDIFVAGQVVVELKVADSIKPIHLAQLLSYLRTVGKPVGLLCRFGGPDPEFARRVLTKHDEPIDSDRLLAQDFNYAGLPFADVTNEVVAGALEVFRALGPGFIHRIYSNACYQEYRLRGLDVMPRREFHVFLGNTDLGTIKLAHLQVNREILVFPVAVSSLTSLRLANLQTWMCSLNSPLGIVVNFKATRLEPIILRP